MKTSKKNNSNILSLVLVIGLMLTSCQTPQHFVKNGKKKCVNEQYTEGIADLTKAIELDSNFLIAYEMRGLAYAITDDYSNAISDYTKILQLSPNDTTAYFNRGLAKLRTQDYNGAINDFTSRLGITPTSIATYLNRGIAFDSLKQYSNAISDYSILIKEYPGLYEYYALRGLAKDKNKDYEGAIQDYTKAINSFSFSDLHFDISIYFNRGIVENNLNKPLDAIADFSKVIEYDKNDYEAYYHRAIAYAQNKDFKSSLDDFLKALEIKQFSEAYFLCGIAYFETNDTENAMKCFDKVIELKPNDADAYYTKALLLTEIGEVDKGKIYLQKSKELGFNSISLGIDWMQKDE